jgi:nucleotide-binding universal stress UspA family protein
VYKHILIPTDGSPLSETAIRQGVALAKSLNARVTALTVSLPFHALAIEPGIVFPMPDQYPSDCEAAAARALKVVTEAAQVAGVPCNSLHVWDESPYRAIIEAASKSGCDLIFMASHGRRGVAALLLGSETTKVLTHSKIPVLVCR